MIIELEAMFVDMDGVICDYDEKITRMTGHDITHPDFQRYREELSETQNFFRDLKPLEGAIEGFKRLSEKYNVYILSTPSWKNPESYSDKRIWVEEHLGDLAYKKLILSHNKGLMTGRALIDDRIANGVDKFNGEHVHFGTERFPNWEFVIKHLC